jgi:hypothetical protein
MEDYSEINNVEQTEQDIKVGMNTLNDLRIAGQWGKLLAVFGFIAIGLMVFFALLFLFFPFEQFTGQVMPYPPAILGGFYLVLAVIYLFPVIYLYRFSLQAKKAFLHREEGFFNSSLKNLKILFRLTGIFTIASLVLAFIGMMFAVVATAFAF